MSTVNRTPASPTVPTTQGSTPAQQTSSSRTTAAEEVSAPVAVAEGDVLVEGDPSADAKKVIDDGKPKGDGKTPEGDPLLKENLSLAMTQGNIGGPIQPRREEAPVVEDNAWLDDKKDVADEAGTHSSHTRGGSKKKLGNRDFKKKQLAKKKVGEGRKSTEGWSAHATVASASTETYSTGRVWDGVGTEAPVTLTSGPVTTTAEGQIQGGYAEFRAGMSGGIDLSRMEAKGDASFRAGAYLATADGEIEATYGNSVIGGATKLEGGAMVGAEATGNLTVNFDPRHGDVFVSGGVDAFAGFRATGELSQSLTVGGYDVGEVGVRGEFYAGIGVKAKAEVGVENGHVKASFEFGAALGIGAGAKVNVDLNITPVVDGAKAAGRAIGHAASDVGDAVENAAENVKGGARKLWKKTGLW